MYLFGFFMLSLVSAVTDYSLFNLHYLFSLFILLQFCVSLSSLFLCSFQSFLSHLSSATCPQFLLFSHSLLHSSLLILLLQTILLLHLCWCIHLFIFFIFCSFCSRHVRFLNWSKRVFISCSNNTHYLFNLYPYRGSHTKRYNAT